MVELFIGDDDAEDEGYKQNEFNVNVYPCALLPNKIENPNDDGGK